MPSQLRKQKRTQAPGASSCSGDEAEAEQSFKDLEEKMTQENQMLQETLAVEAKSQGNVREEAQRAREQAEAALQAR